jgi:hypothetical protein
MTFRPFRPIRSVPTGGAAALAGLAIRLRRCAGAVTVHLGVLVAVWGFCFAAAEPPPDEHASGAVLTPRPRMRLLDSDARGDAVPSQRALVDARATFRRRFGTPGARARTSSGALQAVDALLTAASSETDLAVKWLILDEARRLGVAAGSAVAVTRAIRLASSEFDFDAVALEYRSLVDIPLRALDPARARDLARAAEGVATLAETDLRPDLAVLAQALAVRAWQRTGDETAALRAAERHDALGAEGR